eukprot:m.31251 g.31251  ORF g.31251 m.31251 type:complete len:85 (+) comp9402_c2_seq1:284-538(+)
MDLFRSLQNSFLPGIKNKLVRVIIHKSIGKFLKYKLQSDQVQITDTNSFRLTGLELDVKVTAACFGLIHMCRADFCDTGVVGPY